MGKNEAAMVAKLQIHNEIMRNQIVRNLDSFYEAFDLKPTDALWLDPAERVRIW